jgi:hypothetical protein
MKPGPLGLGQNHELEFPESFALVSWLDPHEAISLLTGDPVNCGAPVVVPEIERASVVACQICPRVESSIRPRSEGLNAAVSATRSSPTSPVA